MKKILLTISVACCCTGIAVAQDGKKAEKKKAISSGLLYNSPVNNAARSKEKDAKAKAFELGKVQTPNQSSKASLAVDRAN